MAASVTDRQLAARRFKGGRWIIAAISAEPAGRADALGEILALVKIRRE